MAWQRNLFSSGRPRQPLVVAYGLGVDSTALLIGLKHRGLRPDLILFYCPASKKPELVQLACDHPDLYQAALAMDDRYRQGRHFRSDGSRSTEGLGRRFSWRQHGQESGLTPVPSRTLL